MIANDLTLNPGSYGGVSANLVFVLAGYPTPTSSLRRVTATAITEPNSILISHQTVVRDGTTYDRHLIRHDRVLIDSTLGKSIKASVWETIEVPRGTTVFTNAVVKDMIGRITHVGMTSGVMDQVLAGES